MKHQITLPEAVQYEIRDLKNVRQCLMDRDTVITGKVKYTH